MHMNIFLALCVYVCERVNLPFACRVIFALPTRRFIYLNNLLLTKKMYRETRTHTHSDLCIQTEKWIRKKSVHWYRKSDPEKEHTSRKELRWRRGGRKKAGTEEAAEAWEACVLGKGGRRRGTWWTVYLISKLSDGRLLHAAKLHTVWLRLVNWRRGQFRFQVEFFPVCTRHFARILSFSVVPFTVVAIAVVVVLFVLGAGTWRRSFTWNSFCLDFGFIFRRHRGMIYALCHSRVCTCVCGCWFVYVCLLVCLVSAHNNNIKSAVISFSCLPFFNIWINECAV